MGTRKDTRRVFVGLIALAVLLGAVTSSPRPAKAILCIDYSNAISPAWRVVHGGAVESLTFDGIYRQVVRGANITFSNGDSGSRVQLEYLFSPQQVVSVTTFYEYAQGLQLPTSREIGAQLFYDYGGGTVTTIQYLKQLDNRVRATQTFTFNAQSSANGIVITLDQRGIVGEPNPYIWLGINEICFNQTLPTPTLDATFVPSTRTPTITPSRTNTPVPSVTYTPSATLTPSLTYTPGGPTLTATATGTATNPPIAGTMENKAIPTIYDGDQLNCLDITNPCNPIPVPNFGSLDLPSPTAIAMLPSLTALPSMTARAFGGVAMTSTPGTPGPSIGYAATSVSQMVGAFDSTPYFTNSQGTPVAGTQGLYEAGQAMGSLFGLARGITSAELGRVGSLLIFLLAIIALNLLIRFGVFALPIALKLFNLFLQFVQAILPWAIVIVFLLSASPAQAQGPTATPTRTPTPLQTWTPSPTLYPVQPSPTSKYGGVLLTPTPLTITTNSTLVAKFDMQTTSMSFANSIINVYRSMNQQGIANFVSFVAMVIVMIGFLVRIQRKMTEKND